jgi:hypothetical protein
MPATKCFISSNTERPEELCGRDAASNWERWRGEATRILFTGDVEKQTARPENLDGPWNSQTD